MSYYSKAIHPRLAQGLPKGENDGTGSKYNPEQKRQPYDMWS